jgi:hypothetical protein
MKKPIHTRRAQAGGLGGAFAVVLISALGAVGFHPSAELASALTAITGYAASWLPKAPE